MARPVLIIGCFSALLVAQILRAADDTENDRAVSNMHGRKELSFEHQIRPILSGNCFACHGPDEESREADLRLDVRESAVEYGAIVPGDAASSLLSERIAAVDPDVVMPPPDSGYQLTDEQIHLLQQWIGEGADYTPHWSFAPVTRPVLPEVKAQHWPSNGIDYFVLRRLEEAGLAPASRADPHILLRRLALDLLGLPPSPEQADRFAAAPTHEAYEKLVDELLESPHFGEHWARVWLDLARYADTKGYEKDLPREMWPYRDWVIRALNADMPYDQFTREQLAGDLLAAPSQEQMIATAFHRNTMNNDEGGTDDEEFRVAAVKDRVDTTMQVWMGLTAGCAKCHSHKFDPISHEEYYQLFAIFNQSADADTFDEAPVLRLETPEQCRELGRLRHHIAELKQKRKQSGEGSGSHGDIDSERPLENQVKELEQELTQLESRVTKLPVMRELVGEQRRTTRIHVRGNFLDQADKVEPGVPEAFGRLAEGDRDRLALANWLVAQENPLSARVAANRIWAQFFGVGIVESEGDFGSQGSSPSHPELLDWLATELRDTHKWSLKRMCKSIVMSSAYRQSSVVDSTKLKADPQNRLVSRGPRFRLPAEAVRDQALAASGLLSRKMYGPPVMPTQPPGVWKTIYNDLKWQTSQGEDRYRRAIYTYWKRTSPYPAALIFDAESREVCSIRRIRTNTPLQALVLMNDLAYLEAATSLASRMIEEGGATSEERIGRGVRLLVIRPPTRGELARLEQLRLAAKKKFNTNPGAATEFLEAGNAAEWVITSLSPGEFASYVVVASVLLNLDESVTRN